ncbi:hypothetical protein QPK87_14115 [Kamptonema cortianum]|nr:hypothetical protein [Geitlerinema splendidum]MDK3157703.1 hypothetical protein [Kamptonema cortianum]
MSRKAAKLWTIWRQLPGNLLPILFCAPFLALALREFGDAGATTLFFVWVASFCVSGWLAINFLGLTGNRSLKRTLRRRLPVLYEDLTADSIFVGFSRPGHRGLLDPHQDIGFLVIGENDLTFFGEIQKFSLEKDLITSISSKPNIHSVLFLGGWIAITAQAGERLYQMRIEPREKSTLLGNNRYRRRLIRQLNDWRSASAEPREMP